ncbi:MAG: phosphohistidine phosphatase [Pseudonocardiales bacterium]|jgi:phosphohistidine phosphatase|nr:phosphohistidine phosphatase [Pseudonocardiales bacterium]
MAARLVVIRHAKAGEAPLDIERPLTDRGLRDAAAIGDWLRDAGVAPERAVVSPARRARETWQEAAARLDDAPEAVIDERIYDNDVDLLLDIVHETPDDVGTLVLVGHNPAFGALAVELDDRRGDADARRGLHAAFPTSAVAVFDIAGSWADVDEGVGTLTGFAAPRGH